MEEKPGSFYLGRQFNHSKKALEKDLFLYESKNMVTHAVCLGMTGSGKTGLGIALLEEAGLNKIPALIIDPKGDMANLMLLFPKLQASDFRPWVDVAEAARKGETAEHYAETTAAIWKDGLKKWDEDGERIQKLKDKADIAIYTPASQAGIPLSILNSFAAPSEETLIDSEAMRDRVQTTTSSLLGLLGIDADPIKSREHILISTIIDKAWREKKDLDLATLIQQIQKPPFSKVGVFATETFFPQKERLSLAMSLNNLLASTGFQAWMEGEPLDIQNLLYTKEGKPKLAILSIAHLSDSERMFFVTLFLNELLSWMRRQSGTSSLRALLYMDEIFGYFPPTAMPPSKTPMLTLLKQGRAFGLGVMLATQNPVDLDYKGLANCGTWFIGKIQTERDKARVLEGLNVASNGDINAAELDKMIAATGNRVFILRSVYLKDPLLFETRWTMSYLRGPLTLPQIHSLMQTRIPALAKQSAKKNLETKPTAPIGVEELYVKEQGHFKPKILGIGKLHFVDSKNKVDVWKQLAIAAPVSEEDGQIEWESGEDITSVLSQLSKEHKENATFEELPASLMQSKNYASFAKTFNDYLYQTQSYDLYESDEADLSSNPGESEADFKTRLTSVLQGKLQEQVTKVRADYDKKIQILQDRMQRATEKAATQRSQASRQKWDTYISMGTTLLGTLFGKKISKGVLSQGGTSIRKAGKMSQEEEQAANAEQSVETLQQQLEALRMDRDKEVSRILATVSPDQLKLKTLKIKPRKSDIAIEKIALLWVPA